ncbi:MAG: iron ABC transporter permease [Candidatus Edwardsbacteria bacterium]|nr:iron ABC transporter permease [Candidatus Edwardsbacteria bacterium]
MRAQNRTWPYWLIMLSALALGLGLGPSGLSIPTDPQILALRGVRVLLALMAGFGLAASGASLQAVLGNPLAEPYLLGVSGGAACGAALAIVLGLGKGMLGAFAVPLFSFVFGLVTIVFVYRLSRIHGRLPAETLILSGVVVNAFFSGAIMLLMSLAGRQLQEMVLLMMGNLGTMFTTATLPAFALSFGLTVAGAIWLWRQGADLNLLALGEPQAKSLGVEVESLKRRVFIVTALISAGVIALAGVIGFVGLIVPHLARMISGPDNRRLIPAAAALGASLLVLADAMARSLFAWELPVGVITTMLGVPFFVFLLWQRKRSLH